MKKTTKIIQQVVIVLLVGFSAFSQTIEDISFGTDDTFEVVTWNIEHFPKNNQTTIDYVKRVIKAMNADIYALQEVSNINDFNQLVSELPEYDGYIDSDKFRGLAYIYKKSTIQINSTYEIYNSSTYYRAFPRYPMVMDFNYKEERMIVINNHFKCCGDGFLETSNLSDEENRRQSASSLLKQYIDTNFADLNVILVGDLNDILTDRESDNVFQMYFDDAENYKFVDYDIATGTSSDWSFPTWPSHLDHILITNELFDEFANNDSAVEVIKIEDYLAGGWNTYDSNISDHRPVALKFKSNKTLHTNDETFKAKELTSFPNPVNHQTTFTFRAVKEKGEIVIFNPIGQKVFRQNITIGESNFVWTPSKKLTGVYIAKLLIDNRKPATIRLILNK